MRELTIGELRFIGESADDWLMQVYSRIGQMDDVPEDIDDRIADMQAQFVEGFRQYYTDTRAASDNVDSDVILEDFKVRWATDHPEFFEMIKE